MLRENRSISRAQENFTVTNAERNQARYPIERAKSYVGEDLTLRFSGVQLRRGAQMALGS